MPPVSDTIEVTTDGQTLPTSEVLTGRGFVTGKSGSGKSILQGTPVYTEEGRKPIEDVSPGDRVLSLNRESYKQEFRKVRDTIEHVAENLLKITLEDGTELVGTADHSFLTDCDGGIVPVRGDEVKRGTWMPLSRHLPSPGTVQEIDLGEYVPTASTVTVEDDVIRGGGKQWARRLELTHASGRILGLYLAEGSVFSRYAVRIADNNEAVRTFLEQHGFDVQGPICERASEPFGVFVEQEFHDGSTNKHIPEWVFDAPFEFKTGLLSGYFDGEGSVTEAAVTVSSTSLQLLAGIKEVLRQFGVSSSIRETTDRYDERDPEFSRLTIDSFSIESFADVVNLVTDDTRHQLNRLIQEFRSGDQDHSAGLIPSFGETFNDGTRARGRPRRERENRPRGTGDHQITLNQPTGRHPVNQGSADCGAGGRVRALGTSDIQWKRVASVENLNGERRVYDLDVECNDNFIANGVFVHNSNSASVVAEELLERGLPLLIVDTDGEYLGLTDRYELHHVGKSDTADTDIDDVDPAELAELGLERNVPIILDLSGIVDAAVAADTARRVIDQLFRTGNRIRKPFLVIVEEIHEFLPETGKRGDISETLLRVAKRGRKRGIGLCGISQRPAAVDKDFITQCDWIVWHRLTWDNDTRVVQSMIGPEYAEAVQELDTGEALLMADWDDSIRRVRFRQKRTRDIGATPGLDRFEAAELHRGGATSSSAAGPDDGSSVQAADAVESAGVDTEAGSGTGPDTNRRAEPWPGHDRIETESAPPQATQAAEPADPIAEIGHLIAFVVSRLFRPVRVAGRGLDRVVAGARGDGAMERSTGTRGTTNGMTGPRLALALLAILTVLAILVAWVLMA